MDEPVLVHADIDERAKLCHVRNNALQHHSSLHMIDCMNLFVKLRRHELVAWITARFAQFRQDIVERVCARGKPGPVNSLQQLRRPYDVIPRSFEGFGKLLYHWTRL